MADSADFIDDDRLLVDGRNKTYLCASERVLALQLCFFSTACCTSCPLSSSSLDLARARAVPLQILRLFGKNKRAPLKIIFVYTPVTAALYLHVIATT